MLCQCIVSLVVFVVTCTTVSNTVQEDGDQYAVFQYQAPPPLDWWQTAVFYQIYPRSFMDSDGDGYGDLKGITSRLQHLADTGITAAWLSPIFQSPGVDLGYDISDYRSIDKMFGTIDDLKELLAEGKRLGIRIILDFVPNHTSDEHEWFQLSENKTAGYEDYYMWVDGVEGEPPNNWISLFKGPAWTWSDKRQQYYLHQFHRKQADLNFNNPKVLQELKDILTFYMDLGVDGFRIDAVPFLIEDDALRDEPLAPGKSYDSEDWNSLDHIYTKDLNGTYEIIYELRDHVDAYAKTHDTDTKVLMTEAYSPIDKTMLYYGTRDGTRMGAHFTFNFNFITYLDNSNLIDTLAHSINLWLENMPSQYTCNWILGNHDNHRIGNRVGEERIDAMSMIAGFLPGVMVTYYGEEIGMLDVDVPCEQGQDNVATKNCTLYPILSRDFERTPFLWDSSENAGFSTANDTWLPVTQDFETNNLAVQDVDGTESHYNVYKQIIDFRKIFRDPVKSDLTAVEVIENLLKISRRIDDTEYTLLFNTGTELASPPSNDIPLKYKVLVASPNSKHKKGEQTDMVTLQQNDCLIFESIK